MKTAKLYTDLCLMTANQKSVPTPLSFSRIWPLPTWTAATTGFWWRLTPLKNALLDCIDEEIAKAKAGQPAKMILKMNSITERKLIDKLAEASQAGVQDSDDCPRHLLHCSLCPGEDG